MRTSLLLYFSLLDAQALCNSIFIPPRSSSPSVLSSSLASLGTRRNLFQYSVTDYSPCFMLFCFIQASFLPSIMSNCVGSSAFIPAKFFHVEQICSSAYSVILVSALSLKRLVADNPFFFVVAVLATYCFVIYEVLGYQASAVMLFSIVYPRFLCFGPYRCST